LNIPRDDYLTGRIILRKPIWFIIFAIWTVTITIIMLLGFVGILGVMLSCWVGNGTCAYISLPAIPTLGYAGTAAFCATWVILATIIIITTTERLLRPAGWITIGTTSSQLPASALAGPISSFGEEHTSMLAVAIGQVSSASASDGSDG
jgi:hypothetical protein